MSIANRRRTLVPLARKLAWALCFGAITAACGDDEPSSSSAGPGKPDASGGSSGSAGSGAGRGGASGRGGSGGSAGSTGSSGTAGGGSAGSAGASIDGGVDAPIDAADATTSDSGGKVNVCARLTNLTLIQNEFVPRYFGDVAADCRVSSLVIDNLQLPTMGDRLRQFNAIFWGCDNVHPIPGFNLVYFWNANKTLTSADAELLIDIYVNVARIPLKLTLAEEAQMHSELTRISQSAVTEQSGRYSRSVCDAGSDAGSDADDGSADGSVSDASSDDQDAGDDGPGGDSDSDGGDT